MKKIINSPDNFLFQATHGFCRANSGLVRLDWDNRCVYRTMPKDKGKVALLSGGGSGHEPMHAGFVGHGMLDAACLGEVFTSPTPDQMMAAAAEIDGGAGTIFIVKNYSGDIMNFDLAAEMSPGEIHTLIVDDDVALIGLESGNSQGNRGVAGTVVIEKILGAAAERGMAAGECLALGEAINQSTGSMAIALTSCTVPAIGTPTFEIAESEAELGVGIHGEAGRERIDLPNADEIAEILTDAVLAKVAPQPDKPLLLFTNGLGGTPITELYLLHEAAAKILEAKGHRIARHLVGPYCTALDMVGASITLSVLNDQQLELWDAPVHTASLRS